MKHGDKVLCINDTFTPEQIAMIPNRPVKDESYQVDEVLITRMGKGITLVEISNPSLKHPSGLGTFEPSFSIDRFRLLEDVTDNIEQEAKEERLVV